MKNITYNVVKQQLEAWESHYYNNNVRGKDCIKFGLAGEQWPVDVIAKRTISGKETLTFNHCLKHNRRVKAQSKEIELSLNLYPINQEEQQDMQETHAFRMLLGGMMLNENNLSLFSRVFDQVVDFGYSFLEINFDRENDQTLCNTIIPRFHKDPAVAFWDKNALEPTRIDGRFCGIKKKVTREEFLSKMPEFNKQDPNWLKDKDNEVIDYWYRDYDEMKFMCLEGGVYKREDLLTDEEEQKVIKDEEGNPEYKMSPVCCIFFMRFCNEHIIIKPDKFPTDDLLPLPYHAGLTIYDPELGDRTYPYIYSMMGPQKLHNFINSQIAQQAKNSSSDKWIFYRTHVMTEVAQRNVREINKREGAFIIDKDPDGKEYKREQPAQIPESLMNAAVTSKQEIDEITGQMSDMQPAKNVISGEAIDKLTNSLNILQVPLLAAHIEWTNAVARIYRQMIPKIYTETRTLVVKKQDGSGEAITINELLPTGKIKNNIKDINNNFQYDIKAGPSNTMQKENTQKALLLVYGIDPTKLATTADIFARTLETPLSEEIARRWQPDIDPDLIKYSRGEISEEDLQMSRQNKAMQNMQMMMQSPQFQAQMAEVQAHIALGEAEKHKARVAEFNAMTDRQKAQTDAMNDKLKTYSDALNNQNKLILEMSRVMTDKDVSHRELALSELQTHVDAYMQIMQMVNDQETAQQAATEQAENNESATAA